MLLIGSTTCFAQDLDRSAWTITTSIPGATDGNNQVGDENGDTYPEYIIDGDTQKCFLFVKPGKSYGGIDNTATGTYGGTLPSFEIDMQTAQEFNYFRYRHRNYNGVTSSGLRAYAVSLYARNSEVEEFTLIKESSPVALDQAETTFTLADAVSYRYIKLTIDEWNTASSSTIQTSEFNVGYDDSLGINDLSPESISLSVYPNPVNIGSDLQVNSTLPLTNATFEVFDVTGRLQQTANSANINTKGLNSGLYFLRIKDKATGKTASVKFAVK